MDLNARNVSILISFMDGLHDPRFDMREFAHPCTIPDFQGLGLSLRTPPARINEVFGKHAHEALFNAQINGHIKTPQMWAAHARVLLRANESAMTGPADDGFKRFMAAALKPVAGIAV